MEHPVKKGTQYSDKVYPEDIVRYLVVGGTSLSYPFLESVPHTTNPEAEFDAVAFFPEANSATLYDVLYKHNKLLMPIVNFSGKKLSREEYTAKMPSKNEFEQASSVLKDLIRRLRELPLLTVSSDRSGLQVLALGYTRERLIKAEWAPSRPEMVAYPLLEGIPNTCEVLQELASMGLLSRRPFDRLHICNNCDSSRLNVREECVSCNSSNLSEVPLVHHYRCAYQAPEGDFLRANRLICPKCKRELRHYGVDYDKPGTVFICGDCEHSMAEPFIGFLCTDCRHHMKSDIVNIRQWSHYDITPDGVAALNAGLLPHSSLESIMKGVVGAYSNRDFIVSFDALRKIANRYNRPISAWAMSVKNMPELYQLLGGREIRSMFVLLGEIISQTLRSTDLVTASRETVCVLQPETASEFTERILERVKNVIKEKINVKLEMDIKQYQLTDLHKLLEKMRQ